MGLGDEKHVKVVLYHVLRKLVRLCDLSYVLDIPVADVDGLSGGVCMWVFLAGGVTRCCGKWLPVHVVEVV